MANKVAKRRPAKVPTQRCDMCGEPITPAVNVLKGLCLQCSDQLGGGKASAQIVKEEAKQMKKSRA